MPIQAKIQWQEQVRFSGQADSGHNVTIDGPKEAGGENAGFRPMELMLLGMGGCIAFDVLTILKKMRQEVTAYHVNIEAERADDPPRVYTSAKLEHVLQGKGLKASSIARAIELAETTHCSGSAMFAKTAKVTNTFRIIEE